MIAVVLRILMLLLPLVAVILWLRWRMAGGDDAAEREAELRRMRGIILVLAAATLLAGLMLRVFDQNAGDPRTKYIPPHSENGKVVPGQFVPLEGDEKKEDDGEKDPG